MALLKRLSAQTLLFTGPEGVGRRRVARWLAGEGEYREVLPEPPGGPLGVPFGKQLGVPFGKQRPEIRLEQVEEVLDWLATAPGKGFKLVAIDGAHLLTEAAANALLKLLEEPPSYARLVLIAPSREVVLPTLASRALEIPFRPVPEAVLSRFTQDPLLLAYAQGAPGRLFKALEDPSRIHGLYELAQKVKAPGAFTRFQALKALFQEAGREAVFFLWLALGPQPALAKALEALEGYVHPDLVLAWLALKLNL
ncbi:DNA polymerase III subunit delta' [Thermus sp.]|uniref:DNA polymerase III subunit delta' n=1 Tax=Thermus sp. TaxID=275 RepID=UPI0033345FB4